MASAWWPVEWGSPGGSGAKGYEWNDTWMTGKWEQLSDSTSEGGTYLGGDTEEDDLIGHMQDDDWDDEGIPEDGQAQWADEGDVYSSWTHSVHMYFLMDA